MWKSTALPSPSFDENPDAWADFKSDTGAPVFNYFLEDNKAGKARMIVTKVAN